MVRFRPSRCSEELTLILISFLGLFSLYKLVDYLAQPKFRNLLKNSAPFSNNFNKNVLIPPLKNVSYSRFSSALINEGSSNKFPLDSVRDQSLYTGIGRITSRAVYLVPRRGLGSRLFQYACHYAIARKYGLKLYIQERKEESEPYFLQHLNIPYFKGNIVGKNWEINNQFIFNDSMLLSGEYLWSRVLTQNESELCQSEVFFTGFREELVELFQFKNKTGKHRFMEKWLPRIAEAEVSVAVHVRRGSDPVSNHLAVSLKFHKKCMKLLTEELEKAGIGKVTFFVFSDDMAQVKKKMTPLPFPQGKHKLHYVSKTDRDSSSSNEKAELRDLQELQLMSLCNHSIISGSPFGWWGSFLNEKPGRIVYAPKISQKHVKQLFPLDKNETHLWHYQNLYYPTRWRVVSATK